jgi:hypothetical protein
MTKFNQLLSIGSDAKTSKGEKIGFLTGILYLSPAALSGVQFCPMAKIAKCEAACLNTAGRGSFDSVINGRMRKSLEFIRDRNRFMIDLYANVARLEKRAKKLALVPLVRLNGTSDIKWENVNFTMPNGDTFANIMSAFPGVQFYDYTKIPSRHNLPVNYDITFSYSGAPEYQKYVDRAIAAGMRIAVVFRHEAQIPESFKGLAVVSGDNSDVRHLDDNGVIVALYAKGKAKKDYSGFVVDSERATGNAWTVDESGIQYAIR